MRKGARKKVMTPLAEARRRSVQLDWSNYQPVQPAQLGPFGLYRLPIGRDCSTF